MIRKSNVFRTERWYVASIQPNLSEKPAQVPGVTELQNEGAENRFRTTDLFRYIHRLGKKPPAWLELHAASSLTSDPKMWPGFSQRQGYIFVSCVFWGRFGWIWDFFGQSTRMWPSGARPALAIPLQWIVCRVWSRSVVHPFAEMLIQSSKFKNIVPI